MDEKQSCHFYGLVTTFFWDCRDNSHLSYFRSTAYPELLVASYDKSPEYSTHEPDGVVLVWNSRFKKITPEHVFHCQSPVMVTTFAKFHSNLIIGGTYSGQVSMTRS